MTYEYNDGGRLKAGFKGKTRDCGVRALAIALGREDDYKELYNELAVVNKLHGHKKSAALGLYKNVFVEVLTKYGFVWCSSPTFEGRKARASDLPPHTIIARMAGHFACVKNSVIQDSWDSSHKMVYGYWIQGKCN